MLNLQDFFVKFRLGSRSRRCPTSRIHALVTVGVTTASPKFNEKNSIFNILNALATIPTAFFRIIAE